jgi:hypothetical protein
MDDILDIKLTFVKKCGFFVFLVILGVFFCLDAIWAQERSRRRDPKKWLGWEGWITISHTKELTQTFESKNQIGGGHYDENLKADAKLEVCCCGYGSSAPISNIAYLNHYRAINGRKYLQNNSTVCDDERSRPYKVMRPGNSESKEKQQSETKAQGEEGKSSVHLTLTRDGKYILSAEVKYFIEEIMEEVHTNEYVCRGEKRILKSTLRPTASGRRFTLSSSPDNMVRSGDGPLGTHLLNFAHEGTLNSHVLSGEKEILSNTKFQDHLPLSVNSEMKTNNGLEKIVAKWNIKLKDGCAEVIEVLKNEAAYLQAWREPSLKEKAFDDAKDYTWKERLKPDNVISQYDDLVDNYARTLRGNQLPPADRKGAGAKSVDLKTNYYTCQIPRKREFLEQQRNICQPDVLVKSTLRHEERHVENCNNFRRSYPEKIAIDPAFSYHNIDYYSLDEVFATCDGMRMLMNWLKDRPWCNFDTRPYRELCETSSR